MAISSQSVKTAWDRTLDEVMTGAYKQVPQLAPKFFNVSTKTKKHFIKKGMVVGIGNAIEMTESMAVPMDELTDGPTKTVYFTKIGLGVQVTDIALDDDENNVLRDIAAKIGNSIAYTRELKAWDVLISGFLTSRVGLDGKALFASDHVLQGPDGGTASNLLSGTLSKSTLDDFMVKADTMVDEMGRKVVMPSSWVVLVPAKLAGLAEELIKSPYDPESAGNAVNRLMRKQLTYAVIPHFPSDTAFFVLPASKMDHDLELINRTPLRPSSNSDFNTDNYAWKATQRYATTFFDWRGPFASTGT